MATDRGSDGPDRTIGPEDGSNDEVPIFTLTFIAIDIIVIPIAESSFLSSAASVYPLLREGKFFTIVRRYP
jgi:hypothetical protein